MHKETLDIKKYIKEPIRDNLKTLFNHLGRYYYAIKKLDINKNDDVLDISCGQGYGSFILSLNANQVYGMDINRDFVKYAFNNFKKDNIIFLEYIEMGSIPNHNKCICIETIEHMNKEDIETFIDKLKCNQIFLTFPIGENKPSVYNTFHKCEPAIEFIYNIIKKRFNKIEIEIDKYTNNYGFDTEYCIMVGKQ
jgi:O-antigen biosynthesis protein